MASSGKWISGAFPDFGAIFMSNMKTREECLSRKLFGLPLAFAGFVEKVRAGMILFLFEYENRKMYGVFEAVSDGGLNIVPQAYHSSRKSFPAQVQFHVLWKCSPLSECDFRDAIRENYYAPHKFNFGLSKYQVQRLLCLFESRRISIQNSLRGKKVKQQHSGDQKSSVDSDKLRAQNSAHPLKSKPDLPEYAEASVLQGQTASEMISGINAPSAVENTAPTESQSFQLLKSTELEDIISDEPINFGELDFIPLSSPVNSETVEIEATDKQITLDGTPVLPALHTSPCVSKHQDCHELNPQVKGLYSDGMAKRKSVFSRLKLSASIDHENEGILRNLNTNENIFPCKELNLMKRERYFADDESVEMIMENLQRRKKSWIKKNQRETSHVIDKRNIHKRASVFSRLNFNAEISQQEKEVSYLFDSEGKSFPNAEANTTADVLIDGAKEMSEEKKKTEHVIFERNCGYFDKNYPTFAVEMFINGRAVGNPEGMLCWRGIQEKKQFLDIEPEVKTEKKSEGKGCNYSSISSPLYGNQEKRRKLIHQL